VASRRLTIPAKADRGARARLKRVLRDEVEGKRTCVLLLGDGVNQEASRRPGAAVARSDWARMISAIWRIAGGKHHEAPAESMAHGALAWTYLVDQWSRSRGVTTEIAATRVRRELCARLAALERRRGARHPYSSLLDGRLANVISLSVDRRLVLQAGASRVRSRRSRESFLYRHHEVTGARGTTRVWFPYGDTSRPASISIGEEMYAERVVALEAYRAQLMDAFNQHSYGFGPGLREPDYIFEARWRAPLSWCDLIMAGPLVIVGASLSMHDWPLWWMLHQRARYHVPFKEDESPQGFYLAVRGDDVDHVVNGAAGLEVVSFASHQELWRFVLGALSAKGIDRSPW